MPRNSQGASPCSGGQASRGCECLTVERMRRRIRPIAASSQCQTTYWRATSYFPASASPLPATTKALARRPALRPHCASYHNGGSRHRLERLTQALDSRIDLVRRPEIENEHVVVAAVNRLLEPARHLGAAQGAEPALEDGKLQPAAVAVHAVENAPP